MSKFQDISATQILREINFDNLKAPKTAILTIWVVVNFEFLEISSVRLFQKSKFKASKNVKMADFNLLKSAKIDLT